jgi:hypothetical protein
VDQAADLLGDPADAKRAPAERERIVGAPELELYVGQAQQDPGGQLVVGLALEGLGEQSEGLPVAPRIGVLEPSTMQF